MTLKRQTSAEWTQIDNLSSVAFGEAYLWARGVSAQAERILDESSDQIAQRVDALACAGTP